jgi:activator of 2-hydroxyglutaryl-CoA dehydratase
LAEWVLQQDPDRTAATSTKSGREEAMAVVHAVAEDPAHQVHKAVESLHDEESSAEALRHVLVGGVPSVKAFAEELAEAEGGEVLAPHTATKIIGEVLADLDS